MARSTLAGHPSREGGLARRVGGKQRLDPELLQRDVDGRPQGSDGGEQIQGDLIAPQLDRKEDGARLTHALSPPQRPKHGEQLFEQRLIESVSTAGPGQLLLDRDVSKTLNRALSRRSFP